MISFKDVSPFLNFIYEIGHRIYCFFVELGLVGTLTFNDFSTGNLPTFTSPFTSETYEISQIYKNIIGNTYDIITTLLPTQADKLGEQTVLIALLGILGAVAFLFFLINILKKLISSSIG